MKVFIGADIEGVAGLSVFAESYMTDVARYNHFAKQMSEEVAAACRGAFKAGATGVTVKDAHNDGRNITIDLLPEKAKLISGVTNTPWSMIGGIDNSYSYLMFIGYHDAANCSTNPTSHTLSSTKIKEMRINGEYASEFLIFAYAGAHLGIPTVFLSGDDGIANRAKRFSKDMVTYSTKMGFGNSVESVHPKVAIENIEKLVEEALSGDMSRHKFEIPEKFELEVQYFRHFEALRNCFYPGAKLEGTDTVRFETDDYYEVLRFLHFTI